MIIAIGSTNRIKIKACRHVFVKNASRLGLSSSLKFVSHSIPSVTEKMPMSIDAMMNGAKERALTVFRLVDDCRFAIGAEGGLFLKYDPDQTFPLTFLQSWIYCYNGHTGHWGSSGAVPVPWFITEQIIYNQEELAEVIDRVSGRKNVRSGIGAVGILTGGEIVRQDLFEQAIQFALSPFYNSLFEGTAAQ